MLATPLPLHKPRTATLQRDEMAELGLFVRIASVRRFVLSLLDRDREL